MYPKNIYLKQWFSTSFPYNFTTHFLLTLSWWSGSLFHYKKYNKNCLIFLEACLHMNICLLPSVNVSVPILGNSISHICTRYHKPLPLKKFFLKNPLSLHNQYSFYTGFFFFINIHTSCNSSHFKTTNQDSKQQQQKHIITWFLFSFSFPIPCFLFIYHILPHFLVYYLFITKVFERLVWASWVCFFTFHFLFNPLVIWTVHWNY